MSPMNANEDNSDAHELSCVVILSSLIELKLLATGVGGSGRDGGLISSFCFTCDSDTCPSKVMGVLKGDTNDDFEVKAFQYQYKHRHHNESIQADTRDSRSLEFMEILTCGMTASVFKVCDSAGTLREIAGNVFVSI